MQFFVVMDLTRIKFCVFGNNNNYVTNNIHVAKSNSYEYLILCFSLLLQKIAKISTCKHRNLKVYGRLLPNYVHV